jgi:membrane-associated protein
MSDWLADLTELRNLSASATYLVLFTLVFVESGLLVGFFLPGDSVLFTAGLLAAEPGTALRLDVLVVGVFVSAAAGDAVGYWTGRRFGRPWLLRKAGRGARHVERAERFYARYGWGAVVIARFIPWVRTFTPILAGIGHMPYPLFGLANLVGAALWGSGLVALGYVAHSVPWVKWAAYTVAGTAITVSLVVPLVGLLRSRRQRTGRAGRSAEGSGPSLP